MAAGPILFVFVDGVGLGPVGPGNPLSEAAGPGLSKLLDGPLVLGARPRPGTLLRELDATLGVEGLPQSATGQTTLLTGVNAPAVLGRHMTAFPGARLQQVLRDSSVVRRLTEAGLRCTFANPFQADPYERSRRGRLSATTRAIMAADLPFRRIEDLKRGQAVSWDVCRDRWWRGESRGVEAIEPRDAGRDLARLAADHDFTLYETFMTDLAGHRRFGWTATEALSRLDGLIAGVLDSGVEELTLLITSDHGNLEDGQTTLHTRNSVPLLVRGPAAAAFDRATSLSDVAPTILRALGATVSGSASESEA